MERVSQRNIDRVLDRLNQTTGNPKDPYTKCDPSKKFPSGYRCNVGNYHYSSQAGGVAIEQMMEGGGVRTIIDRGTKREVYEKLHALIDGIDIGQRDRGRG